MHVFQYLKVYVRLAMVGGPNYASQIFRRSHSIATHKMAPESILILKIYLFIFILPIYSIEQAGNLSVWPLAGARKLLFWDEILPDLDSR